MTGSRYLITGLPRSRTGWLAAVLSCPQMPCVHSRGDVPVLPPYYGLSDPAAACTWPEQALQEFEDLPVVVIQRDAHDAKLSSRAWLQSHGVKDPLTDSGWVYLRDNYDYYVRQVKDTAMFVDFEDLADNKTVVALALYVQGYATEEYVEQMQHLNVQQRPPAIDPRAYDVETKQWRG